MMEAIHIYIYIFSLLIVVKGADTNNTCKSPQYLELRTRGTVSCSFQDEFYAVLWYNSKNYVTESPLVYLQQSIKEGYGYNSGEFDIFPNGSLIVNNISLNHDHYYTAVQILTLSDELLPHYIRAITVVKPEYYYPVIRQCENKGDVCLMLSLNGSKIECIVEDARPMFTLRWVARTSVGDCNVSYENSFTQRNSLYTSTATTTDLFSTSNLLSLLVCKVDSPKGILTTDESLVLVQNDAKRLASSNPLRKYFQRYSELALPCTTNADFFVWKFKDFKSDEFQQVIYGLYNEDKLQIYPRDGYEINDNNMSLTISNVSFQHGGQYGCMYGNATHDGMVLYEAIVYALGEMFVEGCVNNHVCSLEVPWRGNLTCEVKGIRPSGQLMWSAISDNSQADISFYDHQTTITQNTDDTFDITLTARYEAERLIQHRHAVECKVFWTETDMLPLSAIVQLLFINDETTLKSGDVTAESREGSTLKRWIIIALIIVVLVPLLVCTIVLKKVKPCKRKRANTKDKQDYEVPMIPRMRLGSPSSQSVNLERKALFIKELKAKYEMQCAAIRPLPYIRDKLYIIEHVFVEGQLMFLAKSERKANSENWQILDSYHNIFNDPRLRSTRRILEGEPGIGKSTMSLQFAHDWICGVDESSLKNVEILVLLRLRQMGNTPSIFKAIKKFLLPKDTQVTECDIEFMIQNSESVVIILDGFDEYPHQSKDDGSDVFSIINRNMLLQCDVILTTRSSCLPKKNALLGSKRIKMTGFDEKARAKYLQKAVIGNDVKSAERIKDKLLENPFVDDLCQIPLFFVMFAHLADEQSNVSTFNSVTHFFRHIISCLHNHMINKMKDPDVKRLKLHQHKHDKLDAEAFAALCRNSQTIVWEKETLVKKIGYDFYDQYVKIGILVEEEVVCLNENPIIDNDVVQYRTEITFYHKLFCEWYAAHFLANYAAKLDVMLDEKHVFSSSSNSSNKYECGTDITSVILDETYNLSNIDPYDLQYVYRFACGLNSEAAKKIYQYLKNKYGGDKFSLLCVIEQSSSLNTIKADLVQVCSRAVDIHESQSNLLQRSTIHLLEVAARQGIRITSVMLLNCFNSVESQGTYIRLKSGIKVPILTTLTKLLLSDEEREITEHETIDILRFCARCSELKSLQFEYYLLPRCFDVKSFSTLKTLNFAVLWDNIISTKYRLCFDTGQWVNRDGGRKMTRSGYQKERDVFNKSRI